MPSAVTNFEYRFARLNIQQFQPTLASLMFTASANYRDAMWLSVENKPALTEDDYWLFDALVSWVSEDQRWTITGGNNSLDGDGNLPFKIDPNTGEIKVNDAGAGRDVCGVDRRLFQCRKIGQVAPP